MSSEFKLPIIDVSPFTTDSSDSNSQIAKLEVARQIHEACCNVGFFYLTGHNIPQEIIDKTLKLAYEFFHLPEEKKIKYSITNQDNARCVFLRNLIFWLYTVYIYLNYLIFNLFVF
jgi:isopenicillin N synthase-like dioxygenase